MNRRPLNFKKELERLASKDENRRCFDCDVAPALWASINNGIYLCLECSGEHRGFGVGVSFIKSVTLDQWNEDQMNFLRVGGNEQLKNFLLKYDMPTDKDKSAIYSSKLMGFYRRMLKAKSTGESFNEYLPPEEEYWDHDDSYSNGNSYNIPSYSTHNPSQKSQEEHESISYTQSIQYPKNEIGNRYTDYYSSSSSSNSMSNEPQFTHTQSKSKDPRYGSVGSDPYEPDSDSSAYWPGVSSFLGSVWDKPANVASAIKDKMGEMEVGSKILYAGGKTLEAIAYTGGKVYEKGSDIITSDTVKSLASSVGNGIIYLKDKIVSGSQTNQYKDNNNRYNSRGSDDYYR